MNSTNNCDAFASSRPFPSFHGAGRVPKFNEMPTTNSMNYNE